MGRKGFRKSLYCVFIWFRVLLASLTQFKPLSLKNYFSLPIFRQKYFAVVTTRVPPFESTALTSNNILPIINMTIFLVNGESYVVVMNSCSFMYFFFAGFGVTESCGHPQVNLQERTDAVPGKTTPFYSK